VCFVFPFVKLGIPSEHESGIGEEDVSQAIFNFPIGIMV